MKSLSDPLLKMLLATVLVFSSWSTAQSEIFKDNNDRASYSVGYSGGKTMDSIYENVRNELERRHRLTIEKDWFLAGFQDAVLEKTQVSDKEMSESLNALSASSDPEQAERAVYNIGFLAGREFKTGLDKGNQDRTRWQFMESMGYKVNWDKLISGILDYVNRTPKLSDDEMARSTALFEQDVKKRAVQETVKTRDNFEKKAGVFKTESGLLYRIDRPGDGDALKDNDILVVKYNSQLPDGSEFDASYLPTAFQLDSRPTQWVEGLKLIKKGGKITLVAMPEIRNSNDELTLFEGMLELGIEIIDVNPPQAKKNGE